MIDPAPRRLECVAVTGMGEIVPGADLAAELLGALRENATPLRDGDLVVVASKVVAKAEGRYVPAGEREAAITSETVRLVAARTLPDGRRTQVVQTRQGPVLAAAGIDASDVPDGTVLLLPTDPDGSARRLRAALQAATGVRLGVLVTDTSGRPWRNGVTDFCLGAAGVRVLDDRRGTTDTHGRVMSVTVRNLADEIAALADLVKGKAAGTPVALVSGLDDVVLDEDGPGARDLPRTGPGDWFRHGHVEAVQAALSRRDDSCLASPAPAIDPADEPATDRVARLTALAAEGLCSYELLTDGTGAQVVLQGEPLACGRALERLLALAWAEDVAVGEPVVTAGGSSRVAVPLHEIDRAGGSVVAG